VSPKHQSLSVSCLCVVCANVWSWVALQFVLQDLEIALANTPIVHPLFVLYCTVYYKRVYLHAFAYRSNALPGWQPQRRDHYMEQMCSHVDARRGVCKYGCGSPPLPVPLANTAGPVPNHEGTHPAEIGILRGRPTMLGCLLLMAELVFMPVIRCTDFRCPNAHFAAFSNSYQFFFSEYERTSEFDPLFLFFTLCRFPRPNQKPGLTL
jgi:hypothetical protein